MPRRSRPLLAAFLLAAGTARARELDLAEALATAERHSPALEAARLQERAAREGVGVAESAYYPSLAADGIDSWGFPGSTSYLGVGGLMGSPFRSGAAGGLVASDTLLDFGRTYSSVKAAEVLEKLQRLGVAVGKYAVDLDVFKTFYECARDRSEREAWDGLHGETELVSNEVSRFVDTGQRSVVDRYLAQSQVEEARTNRNYFRSRMESTVKRLALLTGIEDKDLSCPALPALDAGVPLAPADGGNPYVLRAETDVELARARLTGAKADYLPKVVGIASVGGMDKTRLVSRTDYSGGLGILVPLFDGLGTVHAVGRAKAELDAKAQDLGAVRLQMDEINSRYDEIIDASRARLEHLEAEDKLGKDGFKVAKNRYFKYQGTLVDLRDALRNLGRIETDLIETQASLLEAVGSKILLNGGGPAKP